MHPGENYSDEEIRKRFALYYGKAHSKRFKDGQIPYFREK